MKKFIRFLLIIILVISLTIVYARYGGTRGLITKEYKIETNIDNSFDGLKIVHFSDLHYLRITNKEITKNIIKEINILNPDIVVFTGDLIDKDYNPTNTDINDLKELLLSIKSKYGKYSVIGNNDNNIRETIEDIYTSSNFILLNNDYDIIYGNNNDKLFIGGLDTYSYDKSDIDKVMTYFTDNEDINYKIILVHEPDYIDIINSKYNDINIVLSGHSHNGQVNIPYVKKLFLPFGSRKYYENHYKVNNTDLYISSGLGESRINFRIFNKPSINFYRINKIETN
ncbi:MAG: metallophosphoesterase [Bacilli bacterium]